MIVLLPAFSGIRASLSRFLDFLAEMSQAMRCAREAERLARLPDADLLRLGVKRDEIIQHAFRGYLDTDVTTIREREGSSRIRTATEKRCRESIRVTRIG